MCCWWSVFKNLFTESLLFWPLQHCALWKIKNFQSTHTAEFYFLDFQILIPTAWWFSFFLEVSPFFFHLCMGLLTLFFFKKKTFFPFLFMLISKRWICGVYTTCGASKIKSDALFNSQHNFLLSHCARVILIFVPRCHKYFFVFIQLLVPFFWMNEYELK